MLPTSGTVSFTFLGGTKPSDNLGGVAAAAPSATLTANFTANTVVVAIPSFTITGGSASTWSATSSSVPILQKSGFEASKAAGTLTVNSSLTGTTSGLIQGAFTGNVAAGANLGGGAIVGYSLSNFSSPTTTTVTGVSAFKR